MTEGKGLRDGKEAQEARNIYIYIYIYIVDLNYYITETTIL